VTKYDLVLLIRELWRHVVSTSEGTDRRTDRSARIYTRRTTNRCCSRWATECCV